MNINRLLSSMVLVLMMGATSYTFAAGFALYEGSARGNALGGNPGGADDPSAIFYNPAGITQLEGRQFMGGLTAIIPLTDTRLESIYDDQVYERSYEDNAFFPPHLYYTQQINEKVWVGAGIMSRFGLGSEFPDNWAGRYNSFNAIIETIQFNPNIAYKVSDKLSLAFGVNATYMNVQLERVNDAGALLGLPNINDPRTDEYDVFQIIEGETWGYGFNAALFAQPNDKWSFGITYNSEVEMEIDDGTIRFDQRNDTELPDTWFMDANGEAGIDLPQMIFLGANYTHSDRLEFNLGAVYTGWSSYDEFRLEFDEPILIFPGAGLFVTESAETRDWDDVWRYNFGAAYKYNDTLDFYASFIYDDSPIPDEHFDYTVPTWDRRLLGIGFSYQPGVWRFDASYQYLWIGDRSIEERQAEAGVLDTDIIDGRAHLIGLSLSRKF
jgi:long-chain fatty acid transport protein